MDSTSFHFCDSIKSTGIVTGKRYKYAVNYENQQSEHLTLKNGAKFFDMEFKNPSSVQKFSTGRRQDW